MEHTETEVPRGVSGEQRELFLSLTEEQRKIYRYHFDVAGRFSDHCYRLAVGCCPYSED